MDRRFVRRIATLLAVCLVLLAGGCGSKGGTVSGKVTHKGKPVVWGTVSVIASDNIQYAGMITAEGTYTIPNVPGGPVKITVSSPNPNPASTAPGAPAAAGLGDGEVAAAVTRPSAEGWFPIPERYSDPNQSGLVGTVTSDTVINLDLR